ncbi:MULTISPECIES: hypothetical protein [Rhizobium]|uniref:Uncharacterized protein n=1 Tax=Rhizobium indicum TaxID=2583231 RepID=A0ABX6PLV6_9HYPH|nr:MULTISPECIES: hypothetical protein [Rhizobium]NNU64824.1 hypothetical protein [Rhizobium sp. WYCCWR 11152]QKK19613.1 hypothetical protein FFM53_028120 [Rhizobium indicum]
MDAECLELPCQVDVVIGMSNTEQKAANSMIKLVLTIFVIAIILAVAYLTFFTPGEVEPRPSASPTVREGGQ